MSYVRRLWGWRGEIAILIFNLGHKIAPPEMRQHIGHMIRETERTHRQTPAPKPKF
ncbi:hypothetical protein [Timonella senegalensis]|uniref:hypothetical protein n=1 Tax=Timonella senegalensis TaxID=1465825 RepID=UPI00030CED76|nr:hypothetical protein [Timonella senegalensis]